jgi:hypothetical protein
MAEQNFLDELYKGIGNAITDIRQKVVEEPMYGRVVTEQQPEVVQWPQAKEQSWQDREAIEQQKEKEPGLDR